MIQINPLNQRFSSVSRGYKTGALTRNKLNSFQSGFKPNITAYINHYVKSVSIWGFSGPYFPAFRLNTERYTQ